jgi:hypothetical protein
LPFAFPLQSFIFFEQSHDREGEITEFPSTYLQLFNCFQFTLKKALLMMPNGQASIICEIFPLNSRVCNKPISQPLTAALGNAVFTIIQQSKGQKICV